MERSILSLSFLLFSVISFSQSRREKEVRLSEVIRPGLSINSFYNPKGEYIYLLNQNASLTEIKENHFGASISLVWLIPVDYEGKANIVLSIPLIDLKSNLSDTKVSNGLFNTQTPFGIGFAVFPFNKFQTMGFSLVANYLVQNKMRPKPLNENFFPIANYPTFELNVGAPVPEAVLKPFLQKESFVTANLGFVFRL